MKDNPQPPDRLGPKNLGKLHEAMTSWVEADKIKTKNRGSQVIVKKERPKYFCKICGVTHSVQLMDMETGILAKPCDACQAQLDQGMIAIHCEQPPRRYAFIYSSALVGQDQILEVSAEVMDKLQERLAEMNQDANRRPPNPA